MTDSLPELERFISFGLGELSARNEHHRFEDIATRIARKRISANILLANGPVSSGGDQQRDAESYITYIPDELPHSAGFSASASKRPVVVACTVQSGGLKAKVLADLAGICAADAGSVEHVAFFSVHSIPEGTTHDLQETARKTYGVTLDVFSGAKLATMLAEPALVWIARHYLSVPAAIIPPEEGEGAPRWYVDLLDDLRASRGPAALTPATQGEIARGMRHATWDEETNADLPEWLDFMGAFLVDGVSDDLAFRARYEMAVARFRGMGVAAGAEDLIRTAVAYAMTSNQAHILDDAATLVSYWANMWFSGVTRTTASEIAAVRDGLTAHLVEQLAATDPTTYPVRTASLISTLAIQTLHPRCEVAEASGEVPPEMDVDPRVGISADESQVDASVIEDSDLIDTDLAMDYLEQFVDVLPRARPFSARSLSRIFDMFAVVLSGHPAYEKVRDGLDTAMAAVDSDAAIAERSYNRAIAFARADRPLEALHEAHKAKANWFHGELVYGSVLACRLVSELYLTLDLTYAAKMYALAAVMVADQTQDDEVQSRIPTALLEAADAARAGGCWIDAAALTDVTLLAHGSLSPGAFDFDKHPEFEDHAQSELMTLVPVATFWPHLVDLFKEAHTRTGWYEYLSEPLDEITLPFDEAEFQRLAGEQFSGTVLSDLGPRRSIAFDALGVVWTFRFDNNHDTVLAAEEFIAAFQVLLAEVAPHDPVLLGTTVEVSVALVQTGADVEVGETDVDGRLHVRVTTPENIPDLEGFHRSLTSMLLQLLLSVHARPPQELFDLLDRLMGDGFPHKVLFGRPYRETADFLAQDHFDRCAAATQPASSVGSVPAANPDLGASLRDGTGYDREVSLRRIEERYRTAYAWKFSLARILADDDCRALIADLRDEGWLDWQIVMAVANIGLNLRAKEAHIEQYTARTLHDIGSRPETSSDELLPLELVRSRLREALLMLTLQVANRWEVRGLPETPARGMMRDLLNRRYHFATDDVTHRDLLDCLDDNGEVLPFLP